MDTKIPASELKLAATSVADDLGYIALADMAAIIKERGVADQVRLIGGHMVTLHVQRWGLGTDLYRETTDADLGIQKFALNNLDAVAALRERGYSQVAGNRFEREVDIESTNSSDLKAAIDMLSDGLRGELASAIGKGECDIVSFGEVEVREKARAWVNTKINETDEPGFPLLGFRSALYQLRQNRLVAEMLRLLIDSRSQIGSGLKAQLRELAEQMGMDEGEE